MIYNYYILHFYSFNTPNYVAETSQYMEPLP